MIDFGLLFLRVSFGLMMLMSHGWGKLTNFSATLQHFPNPLGLGAGASLVLVIFAEVFCSILLILGFKTRWAATPLFITMFVAITMIHIHDPWEKREFALVYALIYLTLIFTGAGHYSLDTLLPARRRRNLRIFRLR